MSRVGRDAFRTRSVLWGLVVELGAGLYTAPHVTGNLTRSTNISSQI